MTRIRIMVWLFWWSFLVPLAMARIPPKRETMTPSMATKARAINTLSMNFIPFWCPDCTIAIRDLIKRGIFMKKIDGRFLPPRSGKAKQMVMFLHGYGANGDDLLSIG